MSKLWGYVIAGAGLFTAGVVFVWGVFTAGKKAERAKRDRDNLKRKEENKKTFKKLEGEYEKIDDVNTAIDRFNKL